MPLPIKKIIIIQPALPAYRLDFFERLASKIGEEFKLYYSSSNLGILTDSPPTHNWAIKIGAIKSLIPGLTWQEGAISTPIKRGDIIIIPGDARCLSNLILLVRARLIGAKTVLWGQLWSATSKRYRFILRVLLMRLANSLLFYTDIEATTYRQKYSKYDNRIITSLNNGINADKIISLREKYDTKNRGEELLFIGRLTEKSDLQILIHALAQEELNEVCLHIIGDGPDANILKKLAEDLEISKKIFWHGGTTDEKKIADIANRCAIFVYPGGVGLSLIHAMAYGLPAILHDDISTHMPEIAAFEAGKTGTTFAKGNIKSLSKCISNLIKDKKSRTNMSLHAKSQVDNKFNTEKMTERFLDLLKELQR